MTQPNLFDFATSELSQDAFICWLASWADPAFKDQNPALHATAAVFIDRLLEVGKVPKVAEYRSIKAYRQRKDIDVLLVVNDDTAIIIEDKTGSKEHSGQLGRYKHAMAGDFRDDRIAAVYLQTGDQGNYLAVDEAGYGRFLRRDFLSILEPGEKDGVKNDIFADFHRRLRRIEEAVQSYQNVPLIEWGTDKQRWLGFFTALQQRLDDGEWEHIGHPGGSSLGFRWHWRNGTLMLLRDSQLWFRIELIDESERAAKWTKWQQALINAQRTVNIAIKKAPHRSGRRMAVACLDGDYREKDGKGLFVLEQTVQKLSRPSC